MLYKVSLMCFITFLLLFFKCSNDEDEKKPDIEPQSVYIYEVIATPTDNESITLKNNSGVQTDITDWTLGDSNDQEAYTIPNGTILDISEFKIFSHTTLGFQINDSDETIYLKDNTGEVIDTWSN